MQAIILAAGVGSRLGSLTTKKPKSLLQINGLNLIENQIKQLKDLNINKIIIVVGFGAEQIKKKIGKKFIFILNKKFKSTNNMYSLWLAKKYLNKDTLITFADLIIEKKILKKLIYSKKDFTLAIDRSKVLDGTMKVKVENNFLETVGRNKDAKSSGNFIGISKIRKKKIKIFEKKLNKIYKFLSKEYYTEVFNHLIKDKEKIGFLDVKKYFWAEVDTINDYNKLKRNLLTSKIYKKI